MENILEDLKKYFRETPREEVLKGWKEAKQNAPKGGPKLKDFLCITGILYGPSKIGYFKINGIQQDSTKPEATFGFCYL